MDNAENKKCMFCGHTANVSSDDNSSYIFVECPVCGKYKQEISDEPFGLAIKDKVASYLYYSDRAAPVNSSDNSYVFLGNRTQFKKEVKKHPWAYYASETEIEAFYPQKYNETIDKILLGMANKSSYIGDVISMSGGEAISALFLKRYDDQGEYLGSKSIDYQYRILSNYLKENGYVNISSNKQHIFFSLAPEGWKRVDELQQEMKNKSNTVFVAMSFAEDMKETRETIRKAISANGYVPRIMDEIEHNHQIVPEMLYEIRQAHFVIAELTGHNNGAYFEAGYALGLGKEVIQVCNKEKFKEDGHFDVKQVNTVLWVDQDDLLKRLSNRIKATII